MSTTYPAFKLLAKDTDHSRALLTVEAAAERLSIGRTTMYSLIKAGEVSTVRVGNLRRVPTDALNAYVHRLAQQQS